MPRAKPKGEVLHLRVTEEDAKLMDALAARLPDFPKATLQRQALRVGLAAIERDPACLVGGVKKKARA